MVKAVLICLTQRGVEPLGTHQFSHLPRKGDWVEIEIEDADDKIAYCYEVAQVLIAPLGVDIYVTNPQPSTDARAKLRELFEEK